MNPDTPREIDEYAQNLVEYVERALGVRLDYASETLPVLDHYVRQVPTDHPGARALVIATAGAYYGEVVRARVGGSWVEHGEPGNWRLVLPGGLSFSPAGFVAAAIAGGEVDDYDTGFDAPPKMRHHFEAALDAMAPMTEREYYSLSTRFDTIEHLQDVVLARAAAEKAKGRRE
ncbi:MAG: hypothetical protein D6689_22505 [Deltaproteobacteria bacterium]|nr:MAG: hypothetical protein D6689_22505 [Deltaproteobacteria bacterium]